MKAFLTLILLIFLLPAFATNAECEEDDSRVAILITSVTPGLNSITVGFDPNGASGPFRLYASENSNFTGTVFSSPICSSAASCEWTLTVSGGFFLPGGLISLSEGTKYYLKVNSSSNVEETCTLIENVTANTSSITCDGFLLYSNYVNTDFYEFEVDNNADFSSPERTGSDIHATFSVSGLEPSTQYYGRVKPRNYACNSGSWSTTSVTTDSIPAPTNLSVTHKGRSLFRAYWSPVNVCTNFGNNHFVYVYDGDDNFIKSVTGTSGVLIDNIPECDEYTFRVRARYWTGSNTILGRLSAKHNDFPLLPEIPTTSHSYNGDNTVTLNWNPTCLTDSYKVTILKSGGNVPGYPVTTTSTNHLFVRGSTNCPEYYEYMVSAQNESGSSSSNWRTIYWNCGGGIVNSQLVEEISNNDITIFPNPANDFLDISILEDGMVFPIRVSYSILDISGKIVQLGTADPYSQVDVSNLTVGNYLIKLSIQDQEFTRRFNKQ